ncbi:transmembrane protein 205-like [Phymastichus coffea]|uniref:transmembrane protein 205-like n=1 Tax=Phymastichus coffea TaxID=108790 RepID=UPI00273B79AE|nr:transmembrane protein 205-like [Phymastichus coffea]
MCVRALAGDEAAAGSSGRPDETAPSPPDSGRKQRLSRAKEKYMRLHEQMQEREQRETRRRELREERAAGWTARAARICRTGLAALAQRAAKWQESKVYKVLFCTTQPAHVITIAAALCVTSALLPNSASSAASPAGQRSGLASFVYLASFVMHIGSQVWMTFVSGLSLYFALPRHTFGEVQRVLFPRYFTLNACLSLTTLLIYVKHHPTASWDAEIATQVAGMGGAFFLELLIRLYLTPPLLRLIDQKTSIERAAGVGAEVGTHEPGPLKHCPHYLSIHQTFRRIHVAIAMGNMLTMACTVLHLHHVAGKLCVL